MNIIKILSRSAHSLKQRKSCFESITVFYGILWAIVTRSEKFTLITSFIALYFTFSENLKLIHVTRSIFSTPTNYVSPYLLAPSKQLLTTPVIPWEPQLVSWETTRSLFNYQLIKGFSTTSKSYRTIKAKISRIIVQRNFIILSTNFNNLQRKHVWFNDDFLKANLLCRFNLSCFLNDHRLLLNSKIKGFLLISIARLQ